MLLPSVTSSATVFSVLDLLRRKCDKFAATHLLDRDHDIDVEPEVVDNQNHGFSNSILPGRGFHGGF